MTIHIDTHVEIPMRDGTLLRADVYHPVGEQACPVILFRTPYDKSTLHMDVLSPLQAVAGGYVCVVQDTRGRFASDGDWGAIAWQWEGPDTYDTVEWIAEQPWCDGNVGMAGASYLGIVQWLGAMEQPPHLKAIAPTMSTSAEFERLETGGAFRLDHILSWLAFMAADWLQRRIAAGEKPSPETVAKIAQMATNPQVVMDALPLNDNPWFQLDGFPLTIAQLLSGEIGHAPYFDYRKIRIPTLSVGGFFDIFPRATILQFNAVCEQGSEAVAGEHRLIMGPWLHAATLPPFQGEMNFSLRSAASFSRLPQKHLQFFDRHLKANADPLPRIEYFLAGRNQWLTTDSWPPASRPCCLFLNSNGDAALNRGRLSPAPPTDDEAADCFRSDPARPVPTHGGRVLYLGGLAPGPLSQTHLEARDDVLVYSSEPLAEEWVVTGNPALTLFAASSAVDCDWVVKLLDVDPDGRAILVADAVQRARYRDGYTEENLLTPDDLQQYRLDLGPMAWVFAPGHTVRLHIQSSNFPHLDRNMQTGNPLGVDAEGVVATQTVIHTAAAASVLVVPVSTAIPSQPTGNAS